VLHSTLTSENEMKLVTGVISLPYHHPFTVAQRRA